MHVIYLADVWYNLHFSTKYSLNLYQLSHKPVERERETYGLILHVSKYLSRYGNVSLSSRRATNHL